MLAFLSRLALGVIEMLNGNEIVVSGLTLVAPWTGLAKYCDPAMALIHASEIERLGPGPVTLRSTVPMAADVVGLEALAVPADVAVAADVGEVGAADELEVGAAWVVPWNVSTWAPAGVIEMRLPNTRGQSMAELSTEARRFTPAV